jgi:hypothetical protein
MTWDMVAGVTRHASVLSARLDRPKEASDGTVFEVKNTGTLAVPVYASAPTTLVSFNGANTVITLDPSDTITLTNVSAASLSPSQLHFV